MKFVSKLNNVVANEGKDAIFKCSVTPADASVKWLFNSMPVTAGPKFKIAHGGTSHSLTIAEVTPEDAGEIGVDAEGKVCKATLQVQSKACENFIQFVRPSLPSPGFGLTDGWLPFVFQSGYIYKICQF